MAISSCQGAWCVVRVNQVERDFVDVHRIHHLDTRQFVLELGSGRPVERKIIETRIRERIIHDGIELVTLEPRLCVVPNLSENIGFRISLFDCFAEVTPERMVNFVGDVETPAIDAELFDLVTGDI